MATYEISGPDGHTYSVQGPEGATRAQVIAYASSQMGKQGVDLATRDAKRQNASVGGLERAVVQGATFGFGDEIDAGGAALITGANNGVRRLLGKEGVGYTAKQAYDAKLQVNRDDEAAYKRDHGGVALAGEVLGGLATGGLVVKGAQAARGAIIGKDAAQAASAAATARRAALVEQARRGGDAGKAAKAVLRNQAIRTGAGVGTTSGAAYGAGSAKEGERVGGAMSGAALGGVLGAAAPVAIKAVGALASPIVDPLARAVMPRAAAVAGQLPKSANEAGRAVRELVKDPAATAGRAIGQTSRAVLDGDGMGRARLKAAQSLGRHVDADLEGGTVPREGVPTFLAYGRNVERLADHVAQSPGAGAQIIGREAEAARAANLAGMDEDIGRHIGGEGGYLARLNSMKKARADEGGPMIEDALDQPLDADAFNQRFGALMPRLQGEWEDAVRLAEREGSDPHELGLIRADTFDGLEAGGGRSAGVPAKDLAAVARGVRGAPASSQGRTLAAFLARNGGLSDEGGDLTAMGAHNWHRDGGRSFNGKLVREDGAGMDDAANAAREAGYFPESLGDDGSTYHPVSPDDLMEALRAEMGGAPRYAQPRQAPGREQGLDDLRQRLNTAGVDPADPEAGRRLAEFDDFESMAGAHMDDAGPGMSPDELLSVETPRLRALHYVKRAMDAKLNKSRDAFGRLNLEGDDEAKALAGLRSDWGSAMREASPKYKAAMTQWGDDSQVIDAFKLGRTALKSGDNFTGEHFAQAAERMEGPERQEFARGIGEALYHEAQTKGLNSVRSLLRNRDMQAKVRLAFPTSESFADFLAGMEARVRDDNVTGRIVGGSQTFSRGAVDRAERQEAEAFDGAVDAGLDAVTLNGRGLLDKGLKWSRGNRTTATEDPQSNPILAEALRNPEEAASLLRMLRLRQARTLSGQLPRVTGQGVGLAVGAQQGGN